MANIPDNHLLRIRNFSTLTEQTAQTIIDQLGLKVPVRTLIQLSLKFKSLHQSDPTIDEMLFLDAYLTSIRTFPLRMTISEFETTSPEMAETQKDVFRKRKMEPVLQKSNPFLSNLFPLAAKAAYLANHKNGETRDIETDSLLYLTSSPRMDRVQLGKKTLERAIFAKNHKMLQSLREDFYSHFSTLMQTRSKFKGNNVYDVLWVHRPEEMTESTFDSVLYRLNRSLHMNDCMWILHPGDKHYFMDLLDLPFGIQWQYPNTSVLSELLEATCDSAFFFVQKSRSGEMRNRLLTEGLEAIPVGSGTKERTLQLQNEKVSVHLPYHLLSGLTEWVSYKVRIPEFPALPPVVRTEISDSGNALLCCLEQAGNNPYLAAQFLYVYLSLWQALSGRVTDDAEFTIQLPNTLYPEELHMDYPFVLGLYRAICETGVWKSSLSINSSSPEISGAFFLPKNALCSPTPGNRFYLLPLFYADSLHPDYSSFRDAYLRLQKAEVAGALHGIPLLNQSPADALEAVFPGKSPDDLPDDSVPLGVLVWTDTPLEEPFIALTKSKEPECLPNRGEEPLPDEPGAEEPQTPESRNTEDDE
ncbi:MAG: hypothetical protein IJU20_01755 [Clostridia bacterium]|nr:hypothetical protein [Clostridia bacterium]